MNLTSVTIHFLVYLAISISCTRAVEMYNTLKPSNVLIQYFNNRSQERFVLVDLTLSGDDLKIIATDEADIPGAPVSEETETNKNPKGRGTKDQADRKNLRHGKKFMGFSEIIEATILYGPEDVECYFFYTTLDKRVMPEQSLVRYPNPLRPFMRFEIDRENERFTVVECEGSVPQASSQT